MIREETFQTVNRTLSSNATRERGSGMRCRISRELRLRSDEHKSRGKGEPQLALLFTRMWNSDCDRNCRHGAPLSMRAILKR